MNIAIYRTNINFQNVKFKILGLKKEVYITYYIINFVKIVLSVANVLFSLYYVKLH